MRPVLSLLLLFLSSWPCLAQQLASGGSTTSVRSERELHRLMSGSSSDQFEVAHAYLTGLGGAPNRKKALAWYRKSADGGNLGAMTEIGRIYVEGSGVARDYQKAFKWFFLAASSGYAPAQFNLGMLYFKA